VIAEPSPPEAPVTSAVIPVKSNMPKTPFALSLSKGCPSLAQ
jgi:hypothetical protein